MTVFIGDCDGYQLSNFSAHMVDFEDMLYPTAEHAYMACKFSEATIKENIRRARSPFLAKRLANQIYSDKQRPDWPKIKLPSMEAVLRAKLAQHPEVLELLLRTGNQKIIEDTADSFWGWGTDKQGRNELGNVWMKLRAEFQKS